MRDSSDSLRIEAYDMGYGLGLVDKKIDNSNADEPLTLTPFEKRQVKRAIETINEVREFFASDDG